MVKCATCGAVAEYEVTPYTGATPGTKASYCEDHAISAMLADTSKTYKFVSMGHKYPPLKTQLSNYRGGYVK